MTLRAGSKEGIKKLRKGKNMMKKLKEEVGKKGPKLSVTENGLDAKSKMIASCGFLENELGQFSKERVTLADSVETLGVDLRTKVKKFRGKRKSEDEVMQGEVLTHKENKAFQKNYVKVGVKKLLSAGMMPARTWGVHAVGMAPTERLKLRRQMAAAAGKKSMTPLSLFMEAYGLEVEEELSTIATQYWAEEGWTGTWRHEQKRACMRQIREIRMWKQVRGPAEAVICETSDLGIKWPYWHTLVFSNERTIDMRYVKGCQKDAGTEGSISKELKEGA